MNCRCNLQAILYFFLGFMTLSSQLMSSNVYPWKLYPIKEEMPKDTIISQSLSSDFPEVFARLRAKSNPNSPISFSFNYKYIGIDKSSKLYVAQPMDRETICPNNPECLEEIEVKVFNDKDSEFITLKILINEVNDNAPSWPRTSYEIRIREDAAKDHEVALTPATDPDYGKNSVQSYIFKLLEDDYSNMYPNKVGRPPQQTDDNPFEIKTPRSSSGYLSLSLVVKRALDCETRKFYMAQLIAFDGGNPVKNGTTTLRIGILNISN